MDTELRNDAMIELGVFVNKLKEILQKTPVDMDDEDRDVLALVTVTNEVFLEYFNSDMRINSLATKLKYFFFDVDIRYNRR